MQKLKVLMLGFAAASLLLAAAPAQAAKELEEGKNPCDYKKGTGPNPCAYKKGDAPIKSKLKLKNPCASKELEEGKNPCDYKKGSLSKGGSKVEFKKATD
ncbi:MAG: hypothetical protein V3V62_06480, partial [bacterium]